MMKSYWTALLRLCGGLEMYNVGFLSLLINRSIISINIVVFREIYFFVHVEIRIEQKWSELPFYEQPKQTWLYQQPSQMNFSSVKPDADKDK